MLQKIVNLKGTNIRILQAFPVARRTKMKRT